MTETGQDFAQRIASGEYDGNLSGILDALQLRFSQGDVAMKWKIDYEDLHVEEDDLTLDEAFLIEKIAGCTWGDIDPISSASHCRAILAACMSERLGITVDQAQDRLKKIKVVELLKSIKRIEITPSPLD
jgi:hypothetical protein